MQQWETLSLPEKHFITHVLAFFAASDGIVLENLAARFLNDIQIAEVMNKYTAFNICEFFVVTKMRWQSFSTDCGTIRSVNKWIYNDCIFQCIFCVWTSK